MADQSSPKYEKPVSIDMGRVAPVLGDTCSTGNGATDCSVGLDNSSIPVCEIGGGASDCRNGEGAGPNTCITGFSASTGYCGPGSGAAFGFPPAKGGGGPLAEKF